MLKIESHPVKVAARYKHCLHMDNSLAALTHLSLFYDPQLTTIITKYGHCNIPLIVE